MLDRPAIRDRLKKIEYSLKVVRSLQRTPAVDFAADPRMFGSVERFLQVAAQSCIDISLVLIAWKGTEKPRSYSEISDALVNSKIFNPNTLPMIDPIINLRNSLVVGYLEIEPLKLHGRLQSICEDIDSFVRAIQSYLQKIE